MFATPIPLVIKALYVKIEYVRLVAEQTILVPMSWRASINNVPILVNQMVNVELVLNVMFSIMVFSALVQTTLSVSA